MVEMAVTLVLAAAIMAALVGVLKTASNELESLQKIDRVEPLRAVVDALERDLMRASSISRDLNWYHLDGVFVEHDGQVARRVSYGIGSGFLDGQTVIQRSSRGWTEALHYDVGRLLIERVDSAGNPQPITERQVASPAHVRVWIWFQGESQAALVRDVVVR